MLVRTIKACWRCEQAHQHLKNEANLGHSERRSWLGLHHHALLTMVAFIYLRHRRVASTSQAKKSRQPMHQVRHPSHHCQRYAAPRSPPCDP